MKRLYELEKGTVFTRERGRCSSVDVPKKYKEFYHSSGHDMSDAEKTRVIESIMINMPPAPIVVFRSRSKDILLSGGEIIDALTDFINGDFRLTGMNFWTGFEGASYEDVRNSNAFSAFNRGVPNTWNVFEKQVDGAGDDKETERKLDMLKDTYSMSRPPYNVFVSSMSVKICHRRYIQQMKLRAGAYVSVTYTDRKHKTVVLTGVIAKLTAERIYIDHSEPCSANITPVPVSKIRDVKVLLSEGERKADRKNHCAKRGAEP